MLLFKTNELIQEEVKVMLHIDNIFLPNLRKIPICAAYFLFNNRLKFEVCTMLYSPKYTQGNPTRFNIYHVLVISFSKDPMICSFVPFSIIMIYSRLRYDIILHYATLNHAYHHTLPPTYTLYTPTPQYKVNQPNNRGNNNFIRSS